MGEIQVLHLLTHTSGIKHYAGNATRTYTQYETLTDAVAFIMNRRGGIALPPQERYIYTTYGYTVLSLVIERASGSRFADYMRESVWLPAGMQNTSLEVTGESVPNKSKLYRKGEGGNIEDDDYDDLSAKAGGGGIQSTAADLLRFAIALENERLLTRESMDQMLYLPPLKDPRGDEREQYGSGWGFGDSPTLGKILSHSGGQSGTSTFLLICRDHDVAVSVLSNTAETGAPYDLAYSLARLAAGVPAPEPATN
jgi:CubicO group peptidase (beta-lactamase class C family)